MRAPQTDAEYPRLSAFDRAQAVWQISGMDNDALDTFAELQRAANLSENTIRNRRSILTGLQRRTGRGLLELTVADLRRHLGREGITASSKRTERNAIRAFYAFALDEGLVRDDPSTRLPTVHVPRAEPRPFSPEQIDAMLTSGAYTRTRAMILLGYYQGLRVSSIARIHGHDIDRQAGRIIIHAKGGKEAALPLHPMIRELARHMPDDGWWFPARGERAGHIHPSSVTDLITKAKRRAGITDPHLTPHSLRHSFATDMVDEGVDIRVVQELMMHESLTSTQIYTRVSEARKRSGIVTLASRDLPEHSGRRRAA